MVQVFVDTAKVQNLAGAALCYLKYGSDAVFHDLQALNEAGITAVIGALGATSQDAVIVLGVPVALYAAAGDITDAQVTALDGKIKATSVAPFDTTLVLELPKTKVISLWDALFPDTAYNHPLAVRLLTRSGVQGPIEVSGAAGVIATGGGATTITEAGAFAGLSLVGMYVAWQGSTGWYVEEILSHTDNALTVREITGEAVPGGTDWEVVANPDEALGAQFLEIAMKSLNNWGLSKANFDVWNRLFDWSSVDPMQGKPFATGQRLTPVQDLAFLKELIEFGKRVYNFSYWNTKHAMTWY